MSIADAEGIGALTMRSLASSLDSKPMSLYHYVANKDEVLDGIVDAVFAEIDRPDPGEAWRTEMTRRAHSARAVLVRHPWALALMESRTSPGPETLRHHDAMLATLRAGGFSLALTAHAYAMIDAFIYGFALQEASLPFDDADSAHDVAQPILDGFDLGLYPSMAEFATDHVMQPGYSFGDSFSFGLDLILDGLDAALRTQQS